MNEPLWWLTKDGDRACLAMYERHYSVYRYADGRRRTQFVGPGEKVVLRTERADAIWVWRKFIDDSGQQGINCAVFRNESSHRSSLLISQADKIADCLWPNSRHYTYVNAERIASSNPGFCFLKAGWRRCGHTKGGLLIMERWKYDDQYSPVVNKVMDQFIDRLQTKKCNHFWVPIYYPAESVCDPNALDTRPYSRCTECGKTCSAAQNETKP